MTESRKKAYKDFHGKSLFHSGDGIGHLMLRIAFIQDETDLLLIDVQVIEFIEPSLCPSDNCTINLLFPVTSSKALF